MENMIDTKPAAPSYKSMDPPSHILQDGSFVYLPPPSIHERAAKFAALVAKHDVLSVDGKGPKDAKDTNTTKKAPETSNTKPTQQQQETVQQIHPLAVASARLVSNGIEELSKAINLATLVQSGLHMGVSNVVEADVAQKQTATTAATAGGGGVKKEDEAEDEPLRASYILKRKRDQFTTAAQVLQRHTKRCQVTCTAQNVLEERLLSLRKRWRLAAPEHGTKVKGPVRPEEVVGVDVEIYERDRLGDGVGANYLGLGKIARMIPRYATLELSDAYDIRKGLEEGRFCNAAPTLNGSSSHGSTSTSATTSSTAENVTSANETNGASNGDLKKIEQLTKPGDSKCMTIAEPFAVADPTLGSIDLDFDKENVPLLTLVFQIEKSSTGFAQSVSLCPHHKENDKNEMSSDEKSLMATIMEDKANVQRDEQVIEALQHSLFCAKLFDSIRREIASSATTTTATSRTRNKSQNSSTLSQNAVWLSNEMDESFLPPPSVMAGGRDMGGPSGLSVVHCHEGEVKVQLDPEYSLTVKLIDTKHTQHQKDDFRTNAPSGSQSSEQLHVLCQQLLLHSQFVFHDHCIRMQEESDSLSSNNSPNMKSVNYADNYSSQTQTPGHPLTRKKKIKESPRILQSSVVLGAKILLERKIRKALRRLAKLHKNKSAGMTSHSLVVEWLPLSIFDSYSKFSLSLWETFCIDVSIHGGQITVIGFGDHGEYRMVTFGSSDEFEMYVRLQMEKILSSTISN